MDNEFSVGADASLVPVETPPIGNSIGYDETPALLGQRARDVLASPAAACVKNGYAVYNAEDGPQVAVGAYGLTPDNLERIGVLKPGSAKLVRSQIAGGKAPKVAFADSMFTGKFEATNFNDFVANKTSQTNIQVSLFQLSQNSLISAGIIKGTESSDQISGLVYADSKYGTKTVVQTIKTVNSQPVGTPITSSKVTAVLKEIGKGNNAAAAATIVNGPYKGLAASVVAYASANDAASKIKTERGVRGAAVDVMVNALGGSKSNANTPVSLARLAQQSGQKNWNALMLVSPGGFKDYLQTSIALTGRNAVNTAIQLAKAGATGEQIASGFWGQVTGGSVASVNGVASTFINAYQGLKAAALFLGAGQFSLAANAFATGLGGMPGGIGVAANALTTGIAAARALPGQIKDIFTTAKAAISGFSNAVQVGSITNTINNTKLAISSAYSFAADGSISSISSTLKSSFSSTGYLVDQGKTILNAGSAAFNQVAQTVTTALTSVVAIYNAVSAIASLFGGKRKTKTVTISSKTATRTGIAAQAKTIFGDDKIPLPLVFDEFESVRQQQADKIAAAKKAAAAKTLGPGNATGGTGTLQNKGGGAGAVRGNKPTGTPGVNGDTGLSDADIQKQAEQAIKDAEIMATERQNFLDTEVKAAQNDYEYAVKTRKQGDPIIAQKRDYLNSLIKNMDQILQSRKQVATNTQGSLIVDGVPYNNQTNAPSSIYTQDGTLPYETVTSLNAAALRFSQVSQSNQVSGIPPEYQGFYNRFRKLPSGAKGKIVNGVYQPY